MAPSTPKRLYLCLLYHIHATHMPWKNDKLSLHEIHKTIKKHRFFNTDIVNFRLLLSVDGVKWHETVTMRKILHCSSKSAVLTIVISFPERLHFLLFGIWNPVFPTPCLSTRSVHQTVHNDTRRDGKKKCNVFWKHSAILNENEIVYSILYALKTIQSSPTDLFVSVWMKHEHP